MNLIRVKQYQNDNCHKNKNEYYHNDNDISYLGCISI